METTVSMVVLSLLVVAGLNASGALGRARRSMGDRSLAEGMAHSLLAEVCSRAYTDPDESTGVLGMETGEKMDRPTLNDVDDYEGLMESPPTDLWGNALTDEPGWERTVRVEWVEISGGVLKDVGSETGMKRITVTVSRGGRLLAEAVAVRTGGWDAARP
jgi:Tfp pilus assembly protein PilX